MDDETKGRLIALETLVTELVTRLPHQDAARLLNAVEPGLLRQPGPLRNHTAGLVMAIRRRIPLP